MQTITFRNESGDVIFTHTNAAPTIDGAVDTGVIAMQNAGIDANLMWSYDIAPALPQVGHYKEKNMKAIQYETGRDYGAPQVLEITFPAVDSLDFDASTELFSASFVDAVRGISGTVTVFGDDANEISIGRAVLNEYDAGRYTAN